MEEIKKAGKRLDREIALLKYRFVGSILLIAFCVGLVVYVLARERVFVVMKGGGVWEAAVETRNNPDVLWIEGDDQARKFYATFWTFTSSNYSQQITAAYDMGGNVIKEYRKKLAPFYNEIATNNYIVKSQVDSTALVGVADGKIKLNVYGTMFLENDAVVETRNMDMVLIMYVVNRVPVKNPHGLSIEGMDVPAGGTQTISVEEK